LTCLPPLAEKISKSHYPVDEFSRTIGVKFPAVESFVYLELVVRRVALRTA